MKELYIQAHEELIEQYMEKFPKASENEAYERTADAAYNRMRDRYADMADAAKQRAKDDGNWPPKLKHRSTDPQ